MSTPSEKTRYLLDKNVARYAIAGLRFGHLRPLSHEELGALIFWRAMELQGASLFISHTSFHILHRLAGYAEVQTLLDSVAVLWPTRYYTRWTRRIRETTGLSREDCAQIALASFGTDSEGRILGVHYLVTYDQPLARGYRNYIAVLNRRLHAMTAQLPPPFNQALLPALATPDEFLGG